MGAVPLPRPRTILARGLRCLCPACGRGRVFERGFTSFEACRACGFAFERGPGHWIGGSEINLLVTYPVSVVALAVPCLLWGASWLTAGAGGLLAAAIGVAIHRPARGLFFALDYLVEPRWRSGGEDGGDRDGDGGARLLPDAPRGGTSRGAPIELPVAEPAPRPDAERIAPEPAPAATPAPAPAR